jgi:hypothetical protein
VACFTWLVTGISLAWDTLAGIPILTVVLASVRPLMAGERALAIVLLDADLPPVGLAPRGDGLLRRPAAYRTDGATWRGVAYLLARFVLGMFTFSVGVTAYSAALYAIAAPFAPRDLGFWRVDTVLDGLALVPFGVLALVASVWIGMAMAALSRELIRWAIR